MATFTALNLEPEDDSEEEVDDTKEIQLEEAFKLYQNALKLHSQGPQYYNQASEAYRELFQSEVFKYPEVVSEFARDELDTGGPDSALISEAVPLSLVSAENADNSHNSLPQLVYLAFKNRGQFALDNPQVGPHGDPPSTRNDWFQKSSAGRHAIKDFADALERDDTDLDLWRKVARVAEVFESERISRFCLESVLAGDDPEAAEIELSGLDEAFAATELKEVLGILKDDLSLSQNVEVQPKAPLLALMKNRLDPYPFLPLRQHDLTYSQEHRRPLSFKPHTRTLRPTARSWLSIGQSLLQALVSEQQNIFIELPDAPEAEPAVNGRAINGTDLHEESHHDIAKMTEEVESPEKMDDYNTKVANSSPVKQEPGEAAPTQPENAPNDGGAEGRPIDPGLEEIHPQESATVALPTRKRSSTVAGIEDPGEAGRIKSKRLRARESNADTLLPEQEITTNLAQYYEDQLQEYAIADQWMFGIVDSLLVKLGLEEIGVPHLNELNTTLNSSGAETGQATRSPHTSSQGALDLNRALTSWNDDMTNAILYGHGSNDFGGRKVGLTLFLEHSRPSPQKQLGHSESLLDEGVQAFVESNNSSWTNLHQATFAWVESLLRPSILATSDDLSHPKNGSPNASAYCGTLWSEELKQTLVLMIVREDEHVYRTMQEQFIALDESILQSQTGGQMRLSPTVIGSVEKTQSLFELHLDVYSLITNPSSQVDQMTRVEQRDRLNRWADLAGGFINHYVNNNNDLALDDKLVLRFIWASTTYAVKADTIVQEHVMLCLHDLQSLLYRAGNITIVLPNNAAMPEISALAVQQEISRLTTLEFFTSIFDSDSTNPIGVIESLEPILEPSTNDSNEEVESHDESHGVSDAQDTRAVQQNSHVRKLKDFLAAGDASLKLFLWRRLRDAYQAIDYPPKVVSCYLRAIEAIAQEIGTDRHLVNNDGDRQISLLKWLKDADDLVAKLLLKVTNDPAAFEYLDEAHLRSSMTAVMHLSRILHSFALYEDSVRVGQVSAPTLKSSSAKTFERVKDKFREMQMRLWTLQYTLLKEAMVQSQELFPNATDELADYLRSVHSAMGVRHYCRHSNKIFLKVTKAALLATRTEEDYSVEIAQVLFDLHQLRFTPGVGDADHGCAPEPLDKKTAAQMVDVVMLQARRMNIKDLIKSEMKGTIDKIQQTIGVPKSSPNLSHNKKTITAFLKSPINPRELYRSIKGIGDLATRPVQSEAARVANRGWYFLLGHIALTRFKSVKRVNPTPTDELDIAASFFRQDLEHGIEKWETWYRLAQVYDAKIEDDLLWTADKINNHRQELATLQRNAIHAYAMAAAVAIRTADDQYETSQKISEMYAEFASRLYASSREPLGMDAFKADLHPKFYSGGVNQQIYKSLPFAGMRPFAVWNLASYLLRRALIHKPKSWSIQYMLGKCLWKMFNSPSPEQGRRKVEVDEVIDAFTAAVEASPERKDRSSDYVLEPHFKLVSIVHKLVHRRVISPMQGRGVLQATPYARKVHLSEDEEGPEWEPYVLDILKKLGHADKSNWHHRIIARAAHVIYDDQPGVAGALGAKHEFTQQIFTKTMTLQVWKPEHERAGRHFVYTSRYVKFFVELLSQINDRTNLDLLVRRIRRKPTDYLNHQDVWEEVVVTYVKLLRRSGKIPEGHEKFVFENLNHDEFTVRAEKVERWAHDPDTTSLVLDILRDTIELKRLNNSLMKGSLIDDLVADTYASMYETYVSQMPPEDKGPAERPTEQGAGIGTSSIAAPTGDDNRDRMKLGNVLTPQTDGSTDIGISKPLLPTVTPIGLGLQTNPMYTGTSASAFGPGIGIQMPAVIAKTVRVKQITRREIQRKAEGVVVRPPPIKTPILTKKPIVIEIPTPSRDLKEYPSIDTGADNSTNEQGTMAGTRVDELMKDDADASSGLSSRSGSVHDSADDESELSDLEERDEDNEIKAERVVRQVRPLFPGLLATATGAGASGVGHHNMDSDVEIADSQDRMEVDDSQGER
jgi:tetratricopeptide (TPR) repeat protein